MSKHNTALWYDMQRESMYAFFEHHLVIDSDLSVDTIKKVYPMFSKCEIVYYLWKEFDGDCLDYLTE